MLFQMLPSAPELSSGATMLHYLENSHCGKIDRELSNLERSIA
jgi:hypothetical protein